MTALQKGDIIKVQTGTGSTIGLVVSVTEKAVSIFRDSGEVWFDLKDHAIEKLGEL